MAAPKGNHNAVGPHASGGGGSQTEYQKRINTELLAEMFLKELSKEEVQTKLKSGKYSLKDAFLSKGFGGKESILLAIFNKLFPELVKTETEGKYQLNFDGESIYIHSAQNTEGSDESKDKVQSDGMRPPLGEDNIDGQSTNL